MGNEKELEENLEKISQEIRKLKKVGQVLAESKLNEKTVVWLISRASGVNQGDCRLIMDSLQELERMFLKME